MNVWTVVHPVKIHSLVRVVRKINNVATQLVPSALIESTVLSVSQDTL